MTYFSGFSLSYEQELFDEYIDDQENIVAGFSYGAIKAVEYAKSTDKRVDKLILFSPAFFELESEKFKRLQLIYFKKDRQAYIQNFIQNISYSNSIDVSRYIIDGSYRELEELLFHKWDRDILQELKKDIEIRVYLGSDDKIINSSVSLQFWQKYADVYLLNKKGHILK